MIRSALRDDMGRLVGASALLIAAAAAAHEVGPLGGHRLDWRSAQIETVIAGGSPIHYPSRIARVNGRRCLVGNAFNVRVRDDYAFDIDEMVDLELVTTPARAPTNIRVSWDKADSGFGAGADGATVSATLTPAEKPVWQILRFTLDRARFANRGFAASDIQIAGAPILPKGATEAQLLEALRQPITICGIRLRRSLTTPRPTGFAGLTIRIEDEDGRPTAARIGLYDASDRMPLPGEQALSFRTFDDAVRLTTLRAGTVPWPAANRSAFYVDDRYQTRLPAGRYKLVVAKGPEYAIVQRTITLAADSNEMVDVRMKRWTDMAARGWYSGDDHIHYTRRSAKDDTDILRLADAEDLRVANVLEMGNSANRYFRHYDWAPVETGDQRPRALIPGQEDPRTARRGHTILLHTRGPIRNPQAYLDYEAVFAKARAAGAVTGFAHSRDQSDAGSRLGLALALPHGLVDFAEVLESGHVSTGSWFDFLNLGYRLTPSAGSDFPYINVPGGVRAYVHVEGPFSPDAWLAGLKAGRTFVTSGPMIDFTVNGAAVGSTLNLTAPAELAAHAQVRINPSIDRLDRIELIEQGAVVRTVRSAEGAEYLDLQQSLMAKQGTWLVLRAYGKSDNIVAISAPVYISVNGDSFWKAEAVRDIVARLKADLATLLTPPADRLEFEGWDTSARDRTDWPAELAILQRRVDVALRYYDAVVARSAIDAPRDNFRSPHSELTISERASSALPTEY